MAQIAKRTKRGSLIILIKGEVSTEKLVKDKNVLGRVSNNPDVDIKLESPVMSRIHGTIFKSEGQYFYQDAGSTNGTFVDGKYYQGNGVSVPLSEGSV
ncbi:MAG: FHA domain-containing protein, partial [Coprococcus sp.]